MISTVLKKIELERMFENVVSSLIDNKGRFVTALSIAYNRAQKRTTQASITTSLV